MSLQWIEPLLASLLGSPSPLAALSKGEHTCLSVRMEKESLAMVLGRDLTRSFSGSRDGMNAVSDTFMHDRNHFLNLFKKFDAELPLWFKMMASEHQLAARRKIVSTRSMYGGIAYIGTDFRRNAQKGSRFGFEFRMLDNFPTELLEDVLRLMVYVFDHAIARFPETPSKQNNAFHSKGANQFVFDSVAHGWNTQVSESYRRDLKRVFAVDIPKGATADVAMEHLSTSLFERYKHASFSREMLDTGLYDKAPIVVNVNRSMWERSFETRFPDVAKYLATHQKFDLKKLTLQFPERAEAIVFDARKLMAYSA
jgi:hypothetical protein